VVNVISTTGVGNTFSLLITGWAGGSLILTIILIALASLILGMGLPVTASYIVLGTLSAPALYNLIAEAHLLQMMTAGQVPESATAIFALIDPNSIAQLMSGMPIEAATALLAMVPTDFKGMLLEQTLGAETVAMTLVTAHMIIFWLSQDSNVTPPVCLTAFAAAAIAKTPPMKTGLTAWKLAKGLYIIPALMAYTPMIGGTTEEMIRITIFGTLGLYAFVGVMEGYLEDKLNLLNRSVLLLATFLLLWPHLDMVWQFIGAVLFIGIFYQGFISFRKSHNVPA
jgi:TRAP-type uncharacterized transport system fused permease subunit